MREDPKASPGAETDIKYIEPGRLKVSRLPGGTHRAVVEGDRSVLQARFVRAFPVSSRDEFIELRDGGNAAVGMLRGLDGLDAESRGHVKVSLEQRYVNPVITGVIRLRDTFGTQTWLARTDRGEIEFSVTEPNRNIEHYPPRRVVIKDMDQNAYEIPDWDDLDPESRKLIQRVV